MLAAHGELPAGENWSAWGGRWAVEFAWEGIRAVAYVRPGSVRLLSSTARSLAETFPELRVLAARVPPTSAGTVLDGFVVALDETGRPRRGTLMRRAATVAPSASLLERVPVGYIVTDLLWQDGESLLDRPYAERRAVLEGLRLGEMPVLVPPSFRAHEAEFVMQTAEQYGLDGLYLKRLDAGYQAGRRTRNWVRVPLRRSRQVVVGGWTPADPGRPERIGALLLGLPLPAAQQGRRPALRYVGRVGIGSAATRRELGGLTRSLEAHESPFADVLPAAAADGARWLVPRIVGRAAYQGWTRGRQLRLPVWRGVVAPEDVEPELWRGEPGEPGGVPAGATATAVATATLAEPAALAGPAPPADLADPAEARRLEQHFVYNTLNTIASLMRTDPVAARELLLGFADLTRAADRVAEPSVPLGEELAAVRAYLAIEQARFGGRLGVQLAVQEGIDEVPVPPLQVLAMARSIVQRRIEPRPEGGRIRIEVAAAGARQAGPAGAVVTVADEGRPDPLVLRLPAG